MRENTMQERANSTAQWIFRREGCLKAANLSRVLVGELQKQRKIDIEEICEWLNMNIWEYVKDYGISQRDIDNMIADIKWDMKEE